jgi:Protein of unknown function (DUF2510)
MPLFRGKQDSGSRGQRVMTVNGRPQPSPEGPGTIQRRSRLFTECARRLATDPLASERASGQPIGDGCGLEGLVAKIAPLYKVEQSLIRWVALRGAFTELFVRVIDPTSSMAPPRALESVMGLEWAADGSGQGRLQVSAAWRSRLSQEQCNNALGVASSVLVRGDDYARYSSLSVPEINADPLYARLGDAVAMDCLAWTAVALLRLGITQQFFDRIPEPDALPHPGWYPEPLFAKSERYWDGSDWTSACRVSNGRGFTEADVPLR